MLGGARFLATHLRGHSHTAGGATSAIAFTGAGISTSTGIPDFRGPSGVWTCEAKGEEAPDCPPLDSLVPSYTHMALAALVDAGLLHAIVSQNVDGLHLRSGVPVERLWQLHGDSFLTSCWTPGCGHRAAHATEQAPLADGRDGKCRSCLKRVPYFCHCVAARCPGCGARMRDTLIHFEEDLDPAVLAGALAAAGAADVCLALGSSLTVTPASDVPQAVVDRGGTLVIVNKQTTPLDKRAAVKARVAVDDFMRALMAELGIHVPEAAAATGAAEGAAGGSGGGV